jgi:hypothetical protein
MPRQYKRQFVTLVEFDDLEYRVKRIEEKLGLKTQERAVSNDNEFEFPDEEERKRISLYVDQDLFTENVSNFDKSWLPKYSGTDLSYAGSNKTFIFIRIHIHNQNTIAQPKKLTKSSISEFGEAIETIEIVQSYFSIFVYMLGRRNFKPEHPEQNEYLIYNQDNRNESICFNYLSSEGTLNDSRGNITFVINNEKLMSFDGNKFVNIINIADGNIGIYVNKDYKDYQLEITPSNKLNSPFKLGNQPYKPNKMNIIMEDKIFTKTSDPFPKDIEKRISADTIFIRLFTTFNLKELKISKSIKSLSYTLKLSGTEYTILVLSKVSIRFEKYKEIGFRLIKDTYYKQLYLYFIDEDSFKNYNESVPLNLFIFICKQSLLRTTLKEKMSIIPCKQILKTEFDIYISNEVENYVTFNFV